MSFNVFARRHSRAGAGPRSSSPDSESESSDGWFTPSAGGGAGATPPSGPSTLGTGGGAGATPPSGPSILETGGGAGATPPSTLGTGGGAGATPPSTLGTGGGAGATPSSAFRAGEAIESSVEDGCWMGWAEDGEDIVLRGELIMSH
jgi:hypothetical protein